MTARTKILNLIQCLCENKAEYPWLDEVFYIPKSTKAPIQDGKGNYIYFRESGQSTRLKAQSEIKKRVTSYEGNSTYFATLVSTGLDQDTLIQCFLSALQKGGCQECEITDLAIQTDFESIVTSEFRHYRQNTSREAIASYLGTMKVDLIQLQFTMENEIKINDCCESCAICDDTKKYYPQWL